MKLEDEITRLKTAAKEAAEGREIGEAAHGNLEEELQSKDAKLVELEHEVTVLRLQQRKSGQKNLQVRNLQE